MGSRDESEINDGEHRARYALILELRRRNYVISQCHIAITNLITDCAANDPR